MRPPKKEGHPTVVFFHVTVMSLDSIDENAMVNIIIIIIIVIREFCTFKGGEGEGKNFKLEFSVLMIYRS